jgi:predicted neutral ceramidase superfamily lipid hydrolase
LQQLISNCHRSVLPAVHTAVQTAAVSYLFFILLFDGQNKFVQLLSLIYFHVSIFPIRDYSFTSKPTITLPRSLTSSSDCSLSTQGTSTNGFSCLKSSRVSLIDLAGQEMNKVIGKEANV